MVFKHLEFHLKLKKKEQISLTLNTISASQEKECNPLPFCNVKKNAQMCE